MFVGHSEEHLTRASLIICTGNDKVVYNHLPVWRPVACFVPAIRSRSMRIDCAQGKQESAKLKKLTERTLEVDAMKEAAAKDGKHAGASRRTGRP